MTKIEELREAYEAATPLATWIYDPEVLAVVYVSKHEVKAAADLGKIDDSTPFGQFIAQAHNLTPTLLEAADLLTYALQVFKDNCDCGECGPCLKALEMEAILEKLK